MANVIIGIHGLANKPIEDTLDQWWEASIREGLQHNCGQDPEFTFDLVYWAHLLYKNQLHQDEAFDFDPLYIDQPYYPADANDLIEYKEGWRDRLRERAENVLGGALDKVRNQFGRDPISDAVLESKLKDLDFYWDPKKQLKDRAGNRDVAKKALQSDLISTIRRHNTDGNRIMLIAHSMGSIIAYDVLRDLGRPTPAVDIPYFVTIGSPLGLSLVKIEIEDNRWDKDVRTPSVVSNKWVNFADTSDPVAVDTHLRDDYSANSRGVQVRDDLILNDYQIEGTRKPHKSFGYLRTPEMSKLICEFLGLPCS